MVIAILLTVRKLPRKVAVMQALCRSVGTGVLGFCPLMLRRCPVVVHGRAGLSAAVQGSAHQVGSLQDSSNAAALPVQLLHGLKDKGLSLAHTAAHGCCPTTWWWATVRTVLYRTSAGAAVRHHV